MSFELYRLPLGVTEGVKIPLPATPAVFTCQLPTQSNEEFTNRLMVRLNEDVEIDEEGEVILKPVLPHVWMQKRKEIFGEMCIIGATGLPNNIDAQTFFAQHPLALTHVFDEAQELAMKADAEIEKALGKSKRTPSGSPSGEAT